MKSFNNFMVAIIAISIAACTANTVDNGGGGNVTTASQTRCQADNCYGLSGAVNLNSDGEALDTDGTTILTYGTDSWNGTSSLEGGAIKLSDNTQFTTEAIFDHTLEIPAVSGDISGTSVSTSPTIEDFGIGGNIVYVENPEGYTAAALADYDYVRTYVITDSMGTTDISDDSILYQGYHGILTDSIPTTGLASYSGLWSGQATITDVADNTSSISSTISGTVSAEVNFAAVADQVLLNFVFSTPLTADFTDTGGTVSASLLQGIIFSAELAPGSTFVTPTINGISPGNVNPAAYTVIDGYAGGHFFGLDSSGNPDELAGGFGFNGTAGYSLSSGTNAPETYNIGILANFIAD